jgi:hypothetical protein
MKKVRDNPDGTRDIFDIPDEIPAEILTENLPVPAKPIMGRPLPRPVSTHPKDPPRWNWPLIALAFGLYGVEVGTNVCNALPWSWDHTLPLALGVVAATGAFLLPPAVTSGPRVKRVIAAGLCLFFFGFALHNTFRLASIMGADTAMIRADRSTAGTDQANAVLVAARDRVDKDCTKQKETSACKQAEASVRAAEAAVKQAREEVAREARPEAADFVKMVAWLSWGRWRPTEDDFAMWGLFLRMVLPLTGGLVLACARR